MPQADASDGCVPRAPMRWVDGPVLDDPTPPRIDAVVHPIAKNVLALRLDAKSAPSSSAGDWSITSADDAAFATARTPTAVAVKTRAAALKTNTWPYASVPEYEVALELPAPLHAGSSYAISALGRTFSFSFDPEKDWSPSLKVNQVGYRPDTRGRHAYVGYWLGALGTVTVGENELAYHVVDASSGRSVHAGKMALRHGVGAAEDANGTDFTKANVYDLDLTPVTGPGHYYVVWDGVGRSTTFAIDASVYDVPFVTVFRALLHQRCGAALSSQHTKWSHAACHTNPVTLTTGDYQVLGEDAFGALAAASTGDKLDARGGYHDAGDYDKNLSHMLVVDDLVDLYEIAPKRFARDDFDLPESKNGIPDVLDEATWALSVWAKLQDTAGGVRGGVGTTANPDWTLAAERDTGAWYAYAVDPVASYWFAGAAAKLSRAIRSFDAKAADAWVDRAERAWTWAETNRRTYSKRARDAYGAAELFKTTGKPAYEASLVAYGPFTEGGTKVDLPDGSDDAFIPTLYAYATATSAQPARKTAVLEALRSRAKSWVQWAQKTGYRLVKHPYAPIGYGTYTTPRDAGFLFRVHALTNDPELLEWGLYSCDASLGANADGLSWTTGLGRFAVKAPLHIPSMVDALDAPVPGITVYGPSYNLTTGGIQGSVLGAYQPAPAQWPAAELYADVGYSPILNEFTIHDSIAPTSFAFGYVAALGDQGNGGCVQ